MENRKYPIPDDIKELTRKALEELALREEIEADSFVRLNTRESVLRAEELMEYAAAIRRAADYYLNL